MTIPAQGPTGLPFDDIRSLVAMMPGPDHAAVEATRLREAELTKPTGSLGRLEEIAAWLSAWQGGKPKVTQPLAAIFATSHGVAARGVSAYPSEVNRQMLENFAAGGAAVNQICIANDIGLKVFDLAVDMPTPDIAVEDAMDEQGCAATIAFGMEAIAGGTDLLCLGEMGIGNTTVAAAVYHALFGGEAADWVGPGTGVSDEGLARKVDAVALAVARLGEDRDPLEILRRVGGRDIAALVGAILAARLQKIPVLLDGYVVGAAAAILWAMKPDAIDHCLASHVSAEPAHGEVLKRMGTAPLLDLGMRLGEASGATLAVGIVRAAAGVHAGMATYVQAGVSRSG